MQSRILNIPPVAVPAAVANLLNCAITSLGGPVGMTMTQPFVVIKHMRAINKTAAAITLTLYKGLTAGSAAGTEWGFQGVSIPANSFLDCYSIARFDSTDFLTGVGSATGITLNIEGEIAFS